MTANITANITAIITAYRRPGNILPLVHSLRAQTVRAAALWGWANEPNEKMKAVLAEVKLDRVVTSSDNARFHGRFALALLAETEFVAIFDDDSIPGENWFANCLDTLARTPGILGTAGVVLHEPGYAKRTMHGWQRPGDEAVEVDLVCQAWFLRTEWVKHLFACPAVTGTNGEDIELSARAWRLAGIRSFCPPHPADDRSRWGSTRGLELGLDEVAASFRVEHLSERRRIVEAEMAAGWRPLFMRDVGQTFQSDADVRSGAGVEAGSGNPEGAPVQGSGPGTNVARPGYPPAGAAVAEVEQPQNFVYSVSDCRPRWVTQYSYPLDSEVTARAVFALRLDGLADEPCCVDCLDTIESFGEPKPSAVASGPRYDRIECGASLERVRDPLAFLRRARTLLQTGGRLLATAANVRRQSLISALIHGHWFGNPPDGDQQPNGQASHALRFFTRREIEKLFYRAGFRVADISPSSDSSSLLPDPPAANSAGKDLEDAHVDCYAVEAVAEDGHDYGLTSIVIVTHDQLPYTRACLESIRFVTDEPYELIVVDNGSTDGTVEFLRSCPDVKLIENCDNRGFPAAVNQGIRASTGAQVLLVNNDVLVTTGWLRRMLQALEGRESSGQWLVASGQLSEGEAHNPKSKIENPKSVGLVGPLTNCSSGYQEIPVTYRDTSCLDGFAWEHAKQHDGEVREVDRLIGFCLLIRREVIDDIGLFDERFGIGNYEDDDYCHRARNGGWRLVVAHDSFIHHFGHRTFDGAGVDLNASLERNRQIFDEKWAGEASGFRVRGSDERTASGRCSKEESAASCSERPHPGPLPQGAGDGSPTESLIAHPSSLILSLCMIVRDNARTIRPCLESIKPWVDEMIVVDTGSTDATPRICRELGAQVYHFPWPDSFSIARNESLKYARGEWIFWMDSDDVIDAENGRKLRELVNSLPLPPEEGRSEGGMASSVGNALRGVPPNERAIADGDNPKSKIQNPKSEVLGYVMQVHCPGSGIDGMHDVTVVDHLKLFRNRPDLRFEGRIHEQVLDAINRVEGDVVFTDIFVVHAGADHTTEGRKRKLKRDLKLLHLDWRQRPDHTFVHFNLGMTYADAGKHGWAIKSLRRSLQLAQPHESHVRKVYALLVASHRELGEKGEARRACDDGLKLYPKDPELLFRQAMLLHEDGRLSAAELSYLAALANNDALHFSSIDRGIVGFKARHNLAAVYTDMGAWQKAEDQWRRIIAEVPAYRDGWRGLVENLLAQGRLSDADQTARSLVVGDPRLRGLALTLGARVAETAGQIDAALATLRHALRECPDDATPLDELCRLLFHCGDVGELEEALRELVRRQPEHAAAHHNLGTVLQCTGRYQEAAEMFRLSLRSRADSALTQLSLGYALSSAGKPSEATAAFEQCVRLAPEPRLAAEAQRQLAALAA